MLSNHIKDNNNYNISELEFKAEKGDMPIKVGEFDGWMKTEDVRRSHKIFGMEWLNVSYVNIVENLFIRLIFEFGQVNVKFTAKKWSNDKADALLKELMLKTMPYKNEQENTFFWSDARYEGNHGSLDLFFTESCRSDDLEGLNCAVQVMHEFLNFPDAMLTDMQNEFESRQRMQQTYIQQIASDLLGGDAQKKWLIKAEFERKSYLGTVCSYHSSKLMFDWANKFADSGNLYEALALVECFKKTSSYYEKLQRLALHVKLELKNAQEVLDEKQPAVSLEEADENYSHEENIFINAWNIASKSKAADDVGLVMHLYDQISGGAGIHVMNDLSQGRTLDEPEFWIGCARNNKEALCRQLDESRLQIAELQAQLRELKAATGNDLRKDARNIVYSGPKRTPNTATSGHPFRPYPDTDYGTIRTVITG